MATHSLGTKPTYSATGFSRVPLWAGDLDTIARAANLLALKGYAIEARALVRIENTEREA